jgi:biotin transporter BioY
MKDIQGLWGLRRLQGFHVDPDLVRLWSVAAAVLAGIGFICGLGWLVLARLITMIHISGKPDRVPSKYVPAAAARVVLFYGGMALGAALLVLAYYYHRQAKSWEELGGSGRRRAAITSWVLVVAAAAALLAGGLL